MRRIVFAFLAFSLIGLAACSSPYPYSSGQGNTAAEGNFEPQSIQPQQPVEETPETPAASSGHVVLTPPGASQNQEMAMTFPGQDAQPSAPVLHEPGLTGPALPPPVITKSEKKITVAILLPLSGSEAELGQGMLKAAQLALFDIGSSGFTLKPHDTKGTPEGAVAAMNEAVNNGADLVLGPLFGKELRASKGIAQRANIPVISFTTDWTLAGDGIYVMGFMPFAQVLRVAGYAVDHGYKNIAIIAPKTDYGDIIVRTLDHGLKDKGRYIARTVRFDSDVADFDGLISELAGSEDKTITNPPFDAVMVSVGGEKLRTITTTMNFRGLTPGNVKFLGTGLWDDPSLIREGALSKGWFAAPAPDQRIHFEQRYKEVYAAAPPRLGTLAYDATALAAVLSQMPVKTAGAGLFGADASPFSPSRLGDPRGFAGLDGVFRFRQDGLVERGLAVLEIRSDGIYVLDPAPKSFAGMR